MALSKIAVCFMNSYGRGQDAAKHMLRRAPEGVLITDQYAGYKLIVPSRRQLCCSHVACNVVAIAESVDRVNQPIGAGLLLLAETVFRQN